MSRRLPLFTLRASVRTVLAEAGDKGATLADIEAATGADRHSIQRELGALGDAREKFAAPITSKLWRHFATEAQRDAWVTSCAKPTRVALSEAERKTLATNAAKRAAAHKGPPPLGKRTKPMGKPGADLVVPGGHREPAAAAHAQAGSAADHHQRYPRDRGADAAAALPCARGLPGRVQPGRCRAGCADG